MVSFHNEKVRLSKDPDEIYMYNKIRSININEEAYVHTLI